MTTTIRHLLLCIAILALAGCAKTARNTSSYALPASAKIDVCSGYGCVFRQSYKPSSKDVASVAPIFQSKPASAGAERKRIGRAIAAMERLSRRKIGFKKDEPYSWVRNAHIHGQMDCDDEAHNTLVYLRFFKSKGWLHFHKPLSGYAERGFFLDGRHPHRSTRMKDDAGKLWAVDSWMRGNGQEPVIEPLAKWRKGKNTLCQYKKS